MTQDQDAKRVAQAAYMREWRKRHGSQSADLTPEQLVERRAYMREYMNKRNAAMTPEEREEFNAAKREMARLRRLQRTPEQIERDRERSREQARSRRASLPPDVVKEENRRYTERRRQRDDFPEIRAERLSQQKRFYMALRQTALIRYSSDPPHCTCCGERHVEFLAIDHIGGGGTQHRKAMNASKIYTWLKKHGYPDGYRVLCSNCNWAVQFGPCPHEREKIVPFTRPQGGCS